MPLSSKNTGKREIYVKIFSPGKGSAFLKSVRIRSLNTACSYQYPSTIKNEPLHKFNFVTSKLSLNPRIVTATARQIYGSIHLQS
jgi:hypothetical protein